MAGLGPDTQEFLKALGSPTRQRIMMLFAQGAELSVGQVAEHVSISQATASQQLTLLRRGRVVTSAARARPCITGPTATARSPRSPNCSRT